MGDSWVQGRRTYPCTVLEQPPFWCDWARPDSYVVGAPGPERLVGRVVEGSQTVVRTLMLLLWECYSKAIWRYTRHAGWEPIPVAGGACTTPFRTAAVSPAAHKHPVPSLVHARSGRYRTLAQAVARRGRSGQCQDVAGRMLGSRHRHRSLRSSPVRIIMTLSVRARYHQSCYG